MSCLAAPLLALALLAEPVPSGTSPGGAPVAAPVTVPARVEETMPHDLQIPPRLLHEELVLWGGIRPREVQREVERINDAQEFAHLSRGDVVLAPHLMQRVLGLDPKEYLQLRVNRSSARLELRLSWN